MAITFSTRHRQALFVLATATAAIPAAAQERPSEPPGEAQGAPPAAPQRSSEPLAEARGTPSADATRALRLAVDGVTPGLQVRVISKAERVAQGAWAASCTHDCELKLQKGAYRLIASRGDQQRTKDIELTSSQILKVGEWDGVVRTTGTVMWITGIIVGAIGAYMTVGYFASPSLGPGDEELGAGRTVLLFAGLAGLAAGTGLTIGGFSLAGNRAPSMDLERMPTTRPPAPGKGVGISLSGNV